MRLSRALVFAAVLLAAYPSAASGTGVRLVVRDEPIGAGRPLTGRTVTLASRPAPLRFNLVGLHWRGPGAVWFRTAAEPGAWSPWRHARPEEEDRPDAGTAESRRRTGWKLGNPFWTGPARFIQYRFSGRVGRLRAHFLWSRPSARPAPLPRTDTPAVISRRAWGADESIVRGAPSYAERVHFAVVHHTAGTNSYGAADSAAIVRGIQTYHVRANGWNDIGYNFLVDKYGQVFEGRGGGVDRNVVGAHAQGFNTGSTGVAVLGTYESGGTSPAASSALAQLLVWRLDVAHVDPSSTLTWVSGGSDRWPAGRAVRLRAVSGHRDTGSTACPGTALYGQLGVIAASAAAQGLPKLYDPAASGSLGEPVRITGRLSSPLPWTVVVTDAVGHEVARGSGGGTKVDWTWDAKGILTGAYSYTIEAGPDVRPATYPVAGPPLLAVTSVRAVPTALSPNGDGIGERTRISFSLTAAASVTVSVHDDADALVKTITANQPFSPGTSSVPWDGTGESGAAVADGRYSVRVNAESPGQQASGTRDVVVDRTLGSLVVEPPAFSPNGDGRRDSVRISFDLTQQASVRVRIMARGRLVVTVASGTLPGGMRHAVVWRGAGSGGALADGPYAVSVDATSALGTRVLRHAVVVDTRRPRVRVLSVRARRGRTFVRLSLNEPARLRIWYGPARWRGGGSRWIRRGAGASRVVLPRAAQVRIVAWDTARNRSGGIVADVRR